MSREYPDWVDPWKAAEGRRSFAGTMPMSRMKRLLPLLESPVGEARFSAHFAFDDQARVVIRVVVDAVLPLLCQRSLERYEEAVHRESLLGVMASLTEEELLPGNYEPLLAEQGRIALLDVVEDELLLGVPQVPRNPAVAEVRVSAIDPGAPLSEAPETAPPGKPFAGLAEQIEERARDRDKNR